MILLDDISNSLKDLKEKSLLRKRVVINSRKKNLIKINGKWLINFSINELIDELISESVNELAN